VATARLNQKPTPKRKGLKTLKRLSKPGLASISIGAALLVETESWETAVQLHDRARAEILRGCGEPDLIETSG
jgi:hypothetical protein